MTQYRSDRYPSQRNGQAVFREWAAVHRERGLYTTDACPRDAPERPSTASECHQQQPANMKLARALNLASNARDTLVMRRSLADDEDQGARLDASRRARSANLTSGR